MGVQESLLSEFLDIFSKGVWPQLRSIQDPELRRLAGRLPEVLLRSKADSTTRKYRYAFMRWAKWAKKNRMTVCPASEVGVTLYIVHLGETVASRSAIETAVNAISWAHGLAGVPSLASAPLLSTAREGLGRKLAKPVLKKQPVSASMLREMVEALGQGPSLSEVRLVAMALLAYAGFLRYNEIAGLRCCDVSFRVGYMSIHIVSSKTDQFRDGADVVIAETGAVTCPVQRLKQYFRMAELQGTSREKLFRGIVRTKKGERLRVAGGLSYTRLRELLLAKFEQLGYNRRCFSPHSLRAGGASAAANGNIVDRMFKRHGRWASESAKDGYVKDSLQERLKVSRSLGL